MYFCKILLGFENHCLVVVVDTLDAFFYHASLLLDAEDKGFNSLKCTVSAGWQGA